MGGGEWFTFIQKCLATYIAGNEYLVSGDWRNGTNYSQSTIDSEGFKGGTRGAPIMPRDAVSRTANVDRTVWH